MCADTSRRPSPVVVASSLNVDISIGVDTAPQGGETVLGNSVVKSLGGKGANTAVAAARALGNDAAVYLAAAHGTDADGCLMRDEVARAGVDMSLAAAVEERTGSAYIVVESSGENRIIVHPGANAHFARIEQAALCGALQGGVLVLHLEIPPADVLRIARDARQRGATVVLNPSPVGALRGVEAELLAAADFVVVNELEAAQLARSADGAEGSTTEDAERAAQLLGERCARGACVVVTRGAQPVLAVRGGEVRHVPAARARRLVDTTAAGDTLTGYLAAGLARKQDVVDALTVAVVAAAMAVEGRGAARSIPAVAEVRKRMAEGA